MAADRIRTRNASRARRRRLEKCTSLVSVAIRSRRPVTSKMKLSVRAQLAISEDWPVRHWRRPRCRPRRTSRVLQRGDIDLKPTCRVARCAACRMVARSSLLT